MAFEITLTKKPLFFYEILEDRYHKGSVIITFQMKPQGWQTLFEDQVIAEVILDRLSASSQTIVVKGDSFRKNHNKKKMDQE